MPTKADYERIARFREDAQFLLGLYTTAGMDEKLGFKGNFSGYVNEHKNPSAEKIDNFYLVYGKDLEKYDRQVPEPISIVQETPAPYGPTYATILKNLQDELSIIKDLLINLYDQQEIAALRSRIEKIENRFPPENDDTGK